MIGNSNFVNSRRETLLRAIKEGHGQVRANSRCRGTTTGIALEIIGKSMQNPSQPIRIEDHVITPLGRLNLIYIIDMIIRELGFVGLKIDHRKSTLTYTLEYVYSPEE